MYASPPVPKPKARSAISAVTLAVGRQGSSPADFRRSENSAAKMGQLALNEPSEKTAVLSDPGRVEIDFTLLCKLQEYMHRVTGVPCDMKTGVVC